MQVMSSENIVPILYLQELELQTMIVRAVAERLKLSAASWTQKGIPVLDTMVPPRDIMIDCTSILAATAVISRILFIGKRRNPRATERCQSLRQLLDIKDELPHLQNYAVRNAFEHVDERLDTFFEIFDAKHFQIESMSVAPTLSERTTQVFKRFNPIELSLSFDKEKVFIKHYIDEVNIVEQRVHGSYDKLFNGVYKVWAT